MMNSERRVFRPVLIDSNFLFIPSQFKLDIFEELASLCGQRFEPILLSPTNRELMGIAKKGSPKVSKHISFVFNLLHKCRTIYVEQNSRESNDDVIVRVATEWKCPVATNDKELKKRLRSLNIPVIYLRQKSRLMVEGELFPD